MSITLSKHFKRSTRDIRKKKNSKRKNEERGGGKEQVSGEMFDRMKERAGKHRKWRRIVDAK